MFKIKKMLVLFSSFVFCFQALGQEYDYAEEPIDQQESAEYIDETSSEEVSDLRELEKFKDIAVIQKKYLDKTKRFELWGAGTIALNSQFHNFLGANLALSYHLNETWGVELQGMFLSDIEKSLTENLQKKQNIVTKSIVIPQSYFGLNLRWSPIYGKISLREKTINPFEMYFTAGLGMTGIDDGQSVMTFHGGTGQVYPLSKNTTLRWALGYNFFSANARQDLNGTVKGTKVNTSLFYLSVGMSVYFPFSKSR